MNVNNRKPIKEAGPSIPVDNPAVCQPLNLIPD
jgi:hypothetical protein